MANKERKLPILNFHKVPLCGQTYMINCDYQADSSFKNRLAGLLCDAFSNNLYIVAHASKNERKYIESF